MEEDKALSSGEFEYIVDKKSWLSKHILYLHFRYKVIHFAINIITQYDDNIIKRNHQYVKVISTENGNSVNQFHLKPIDYKWTCSTLARGM